MHGVNLMAVMVACKYFNFNLLLDSKFVDVAREVDEFHRTSTSATNANQVMAQIELKCLPEDVTTVVHQFPVAGQTRLEFCDQAGLALQGLAQTLSCNGDDPKSCWLKIRSCQVAILKFLSPDHDDLHEFHVIDPIPRRFSFVNEHRTCASRTIVSGVDGLTRFLLRLFKHQHSRATRSGGLSGAHLDPQSSMISVRIYSLNIMGDPGDSELTHVGCGVDGENMPEESPGLSVEMVVAANSHSFPGMAPPLLPARDHHTDVVDNSDTNMEESPGMSVEEANSHPIPGMPPPLLLARDNHTDANREAPPLLPAMDHHTDVVDNSDTNMEESPGLSVEEANSQHPIPEMPPPLLPATLLPAMDHHTDGVDNLETNMEESPGLSVEEANSHLIPGMPPPLLLARDNHTDVANGDVVENSPPQADGVEQQVDTTTSTREDSVSSPSFALSTPGQSESLDVTHTTLEPVVLLNEVVDLYDGEQWEEPSLEMIEAWNTSGEERQRDHVVDEDCPLCSERYTVGRDSIRAATYNSVCMHRLCLTCCTTWMDTSLFDPDGRHSISERIVKSGACALCKCIQGTWKQVADKSDVPSTHGFWERNNTREGKQVKEVAVKDLALWNCLALFYGRRSLVVDSIPVSPILRCQKIQLQFLVEQEVNENPSLPGMFVCGRCSKVTSLKEKCKKVTCTEACKFSVLCFHCAWTYTEGIISGSVTGVTSNKQNLLSPTVGEIKFSCESCGKRGLFRRFDGEVLDGPAGFCSSPSIEWRNSHRTWSR